MRRKKEKRETTKTLENEKAGGRVGLDSHPQVGTQPQHR
jgi:hypothetical protein